MTIIRLPRRSSFARLTLRACIVFVAAVISFLVINISYSKAPRYNHVSHIDDTDPFYQRDNTIYVDPLIGTSGPGHVFPGATLPFGIAKPGPDMMGNDNQAGYNPQGVIRGFSQLHSDGSYGNIQVQPVTGEEWQIWDYSSLRIEESGMASPGYFSIGLERFNITVEMTATHKTSLLRYDFHNASKVAVVVNVGRDLMNSFMGGQVNLERDKRNNSRITGHGTYRPSFAPGGAFKVYFCTDFNLESSSATLFDDQLHDDTETTLIAGYGSLGGVFQFENLSIEQPLVTRIGISFVSESQACSSAEEEVPTFDFDYTHMAAKKIWQDTLNKIYVDGGTEDDKVLFYSSFYRHFISPVNKTGENPKWESSEPYYDDFYCLWDTYHGVMPLYALTHPQPLADMVRGLIDIYRNEGFMPDCYMGMGPGYSQGGSNAEMPLTDFLLKHGSNYGNVSWEDGFQAMMKDATIEPAVTAWTVHGRADIDFYSKNGYVAAPDGSTYDAPIYSSRSASRTIEYARNDFAIALAAHKLGNASVYEEFMARANNWVNLWNSDVEEDGFSGFIMPKYQNGSWNLYPPQFCGPTLNHFSCFLDSHGGEFYEESSWIYSFSAPQDQIKLIELMGGPEQYIKRLDHYFDMGYHDMGDEPAFLIPYLYNWAGRIDKTTDIIRNLLRTHFSTNSSGLPGNDDSGAEGSFVVWSMMGFYPVAGTDVYLLSSPLFPEISLQLGQKQVFTILANNLTDTNRYIQTATLNGQLFNRSWFRHSEIATYSSTRLELDMGAQWTGFGAENLPPAITGNVSWV
ncbi:glycosyl hydrolase family 92-domain-containing protein [Umbelopsis sp. PMI_123]|nr:glycosyl hydrolase family 92-domain-containing protein [Umbelopsis sp. PMI_123]